MCIDTPNCDADRWTSSQYQRHKPRRANPPESADEFQAWQDTVREELRDVLGLTAIERTCSEEPSFQLLDVEQRSGFEQQKWIARTEPEFTVPFYVLLPENREPPYPTVVTVHGHTELGKDLAIGRSKTAVQREQIEDENRDIAIQAVNQGYAAIAADMRAFGELAPDLDRENTCRAWQMRSQLFGRSLVGERVWDVLQLVTFVDDHTEFDSNRLGITGHSGGAAVALFASALSNRFAVVAPCCYFCTYEDSILAIEHCECNYVPGLLDIGEMWTIGGLLVPRPLTIVAGREDRLFPIDGTRRAYEELVDRYEVVDGGDRCSLYIGEKGHQFYGDGVWPAFREHL